MCITVMIKHVFITYSTVRDVRLLNIPSGREVIALEDKSLQMYEIFKTIFQEWCLLLLVRKSSVQHAT